MYLLQPMKYGDFKMSVVSVSDTYQILTLAPHLSMHIRRIKIVPKLKYSKTCTWEPCPLLKSHKLCVVTMSTFKKL